MRQSGECVFGKPGGMEPCWMNLTMRELGRIGSEIRLDKTWAVRNEVLAVQTLKPPNTVSYTHLTLPTNREV